MSTRTSIASHRIGANVLRTRSLAASLRSSARLLAHSPTRPLAHLLYHQFACKSITLCNTTKKLRSGTGRAQRGRA